MKTNTKLGFASILLILFALLNVGLKVYDIQNIGPEGNPVGFGQINGFFKDLIGYNPVWYNLTEYLGYIAFLTAGCFGLLGLVQLIKRKSLFKVDGDIIALGGFYVVVAAVYVFYEIFIINYRPVILDGEISASFPSSHTMLITCIMATAAIQFARRISNKTLKNAAVFLSIALLIIVVLGRLISGVHWFTDILGGLLISGSLVLFYSVIVDKIYKEKK